MWASRAPRENFDRSRATDPADQGVTRKCRPGTTSGTREQGRYTEKELDTCGKRTSRAEAQIVVSPDEEGVGCNLTCMDEYESHRFSVNECESHVR